MKVLKAIGGFFVKIWTWIKNTAWVQPLLIVVIIFGVIFSIPSISNAIKSAADNANSPAAYYKGFSYSLAGGENSNADKLIKNIQEKADDNTVASVAGDKYFLMFAAEQCPECENAKPAFETLSANFKGTYKPVDEKDFKLITIFIDEKTNDESALQSAFEMFLSRTYNAKFLEEAVEVGQDSYYKTNGGISQSDLDTLANVDSDNFITPTILLIDFSEGYNGVSEVMFGVGTSGDNYDKAQLLLDCWNHAGKFSSEGK